MGGRRDLASCCAGGGLCRPDAWTQTNTNVQSQSRTHTRRHACTHNRHTTDTHAQPRPRAHAITLSPQGWAEPLLLAAASPQECLARLEAMLQLVLQLALSGPDACQPAGCGAARALMQAAAAAGVGPLHLLTPALLQVSGAVITFPVRSSRGAEMSYAAARRRRTVRVTPHCGDAVARALPILPSRTSCIPPPPCAHRRCTRARYPTPLRTTSWRPSPPASPAPRTASRQRWRAPGGRAAGGAAACRHVTTPSEGRSC